MPQIEICRDALNKTQYIILGLTPKGRAPDQPWEYGYELVNIDPVQNTAIFERQMTDEIPAAYAAGLL